MYVRVLMLLLLLLLLLLLYIPQSTSLDWLLRSFWRKCDRRNTERCWCLCVKSTLFRDWPSFVCCICKERLPKSPDAWLRRWRSSLVYNASQDLCRNRHVLTVSTQNIYYVESHSDRGVSADPIQRRICHAKAKQKPWQNTSMRLIPRLCPQSCAELSSRMWMRCRTHVDQSFGHRSVIQIIPNSSWISVVSSEQMCRVVSSVMPSSSWALRFFRCLRIPTILTFVGRSQFTLYSGFTAVGTTSLDRWGGCNRLLKWFFH